MSYRVAFVQKAASYGAASGEKNGRQKVGESPSDSQQPPGGNCNEDPTNEQFSYNCPTFVDTP